MVFKAEVEMLIRLLKIKLKQIGISNTFLENLRVSIIVIDETAIFVLIDTTDTDGFDDTFTDPILKHFFL